MASVPIIDIGKQIKVNSIHCVAESYFSRWQKSDVLIFLSELRKSEPSAESLHQGLRRLGLGSAPLASAIACFC